MRPFPLVVFPNGDTISRVRLADLARGQCNGATLQADGSVKVPFNGKQYVVVTKPARDGQVESVAI